MTLENKKLEIIIEQEITKFINRGLIPQVLEIVHNLKPLSSEWFYAENNKGRIKELIKTKLIEFANNL